MKQEETKGCSALSIDATDLSQGLCTIYKSITKNCMPTVVELNYDCYNLPDSRAKGKDPELMTRGV